MSILRNYKQQLNQERGFTLIELMVAIVILGVLAGIGLQFVVGAMERSRINTDVAEGRRIKDAIDVYYTKYGAPPDLTQLSDTFSNRINSAQKINGQTLTLGDTDFNRIFNIDFANSRVIVYDISTFPGSSRVAWDSNSN